MKIGDKVTVVGSTGKKYTVSKTKNGMGCSCKIWVNTVPRVNCKHIKAALSGIFNLKTAKENTMAKLVVKSNLNPLKALTAKSTRAAIINLLLKNRKKLVAMKAVQAEVARVKKLSDAKFAALRIKNQTPKVAKWAKQHNMKFAASSAGFKLE